MGRLTALEPLGSPPRSLRAHFGCAHGQSPVDRRISAQPGGPTRLPFPDGGFLASRIGDSRPVKG